MDLEVSAPQPGGTADGLVSQELATTLRDFEEHPASRVVFQDSLGKALVAPSTAHLKKLRDIAANRDLLPAVHLPQGYRPEAERFPTEAVVVEAKTGLLPSSTSIAVTYSPPKQGVLWGSKPAMLRGVLTIAENCFPIAPVAISGSGQCNLAIEEWSHERVCEEVSQYLYLLCREAEKLSRQGQVSTSFVDFDADFEAHLVRKVAHATNLLQLPEYYRAYADKESANIVAGELTERVKILGDEIKAHFQTLHDRVNELDASLIGDGAVSDLTKRVKERAHFIYEESLRSIEGQAVADLVKQRDVLAAQISSLEETLKVAKRETKVEIEALQGKVEQVKDELSSPRIRSRILGELKRMGCDQDRAVDLLKKLAPLCDHTNPQIVIDPENFFRFLKVIFCNYHDNLRFCPEKALHSFELMEYLATNLTLEHADLIYENVRKIQSNDPKGQLRCVKALLEK